MKALLLPALAACALAIALVSCASSDTTGDESGVATSTTLPGGSGGDGDSGPGLDALEGDIAGKQLNGGRFAGADLSGRDLAGTDFTASDLGGANLSGAILVEADLSATNLMDANLTDADLTRARLGGADLRGARLSGATLDGVEWSETLCPDGTLSNDNGGTCAGHL